MSTEPINTPGSTEPEDTTMSEQHTTATEALYPVTIHRNVAQHPVRWRNHWGDLKAGEDGVVRFVSAFVDHELDPLPAAAESLTLPEQHANEDAPCHLCNGEGFTDGNEDLSERAPWSFWAALTPPSDLAVRLGMVKRVPCYACTATPSTPMEV